MFGALKKLFSKPAPLAKPLARPAYTSKTYTPVAPFPPTAPAPSPVTKPALGPVQPSAPPVSTPKPAIPPLPVPPPAPRDPKEYLSLPLHVILARLPSTLTACARATTTDTVPISIKMVLKQLPLGAVRMSFGDLRKIAAPGVFVNNESFDQVLVELPLNEILSRIDPTVLVRRPQTKLTLPDGQPGVFGTSHIPGHDTACSVPILRPEPQPAPEETPAPLPERPANPVFERAEMLRPAPIAAPIAIPMPIVQPTLPLQSAPQIRVEKAVVAPPVPAKAPLPAPIPAAASLNIPLSTISESWPEAIKQEIRTLNCEASSLNLPMNRLDAAMKTGRVAFPWGELMHWICPTPPQSASLHNNIKVVLALNIIAPLFLAQQRSTKQQKQVVVAENIPDIFASLSSLPQPPAEPPKAPAPDAKLSLVMDKAPELELAPAPAPLSPPPTLPLRMVEDPIEQSASANQPQGSACDQKSETNPQSVAKSAIEPVDLTPGSYDTTTFFSTKADWSPREVVRKTLSLNGVAGSLISMSDGLLVATKLPEIYKPETISAFLPQIFGRMGQYTKELQLGPLTRVTLMVNNTPCAIYKTGTLFFMVLGRTGETLPEAKIERIATELAKHNL